MLNILLRNFFFFDLRKVELLCETLSELCFEEKIKIYTPRAGLL